MSGLYANIEGLEKPVSRILCGTASTAFTMGQASDGLLDDMVDLGIQTFDTARNYIGAEAVLGKWMDKRGNRDQLVILSKCGHPSAFGKKRINEKEIRKDLERSLRDLRTDYIDIYLLHRDDEQQPVDVAVEVFNALHAEGKIGRFGASNWTHERIRQANEYARNHGLLPFSVSSPNFGLAEQINDPWGGGCVTISGKENGAAREWYRRNGMPVFAYSSLGRGLFSGRIKEDFSNVRQVMDNAARKGYACEENYERLRRCRRIAEEKGVTVAQVAMAWIFKQGLNVFAVVSVSGRERMEQNIQALSLELSAEECSYLNLDSNG